MAQASESVAICWDFEKLHANLVDQAHGQGSYLANGFRPQDEVIDVETIVEYALSLRPIAISRAFANWVSFNRCKSVVGVETSHGSKGASAYVLAASSHVPRGAIPRIGIKQRGLQGQRRPGISEDGTGSGGRGRCARDGAVAACVAGGSGDRPGGVADSEGAHAAALSAATPANPVPPPPAARSPAG
jgi:hypothetical protein